MCTEILSSHGQGDNEELHRKYCLVNKKTSTTTKMKKQGPWVLCGDNIRCTLDPWMARKTNCSKKKQKNRELELGILNKEAAPSTLAEVQHLPEGSSQSVTKPFSQVHQATILAHQQKQLREVFKVNKGC